MLLKQKVALVTGSGRGIGAAIAAQFAQEGAIVVVNFLQYRERAEATVKRIREAGGTAIALQADVTRADEVNQLVKQIWAEFSGLDIVVNNALSHYRFDPKQRELLTTIPWLSYQTQLNGSLGGAYNVCHAALPVMMTQGSGRIINIASNLVQFPVIPYHDYITAKAALIGYTRSLASEAGAYGILANAIAPGLTYPTDSSRATPEDTREAIIKLTPTKRLTVPADVAGCATFLASDLCRNLTGQCFNVDGGLVMA